MSNTELIEQLEKLAFRTGDRSSADAAIIAAGAHEIERLTQQIAAVRAWCPGYLTAEDLDAILDPAPITLDGPAPVHLTGCFGSPVTPESETNR